MHKTKNMHTIKLNISDNIYSKVISALEQFDKGVEITEETTLDNSAWKKLSKEDQEELLISIEESKDEANLISMDEFRDKYKKWL
ncbi:MAG: hypothetical protein KAG37_06235 [Flavobacteriales bacterium]|nr:hypothetical protein [Flavobacteriales bacterium]